MRRNVVSFVVAVGLTVLLAGPSGAVSAGPICWRLEEFDSIFTLVFLGDDSNPDVASVAGKHGNSGPQSPVSGAAFFDQAGNEIKMTLTAAQPVGAGGTAHLTVEFSGVPPYGEEVRLQNDAAFPWTLVPCP